MAGAALDILLGVITPAKHSSFYGRDSQKSVSFRVVGIFVERRVGETYCLVSDRAAVTEVISHPRPVQQSPGIEVLGRCMTAAPPFGLHQFRMKLADNGLCHFVLKGEDIRQVAAELIGPDLIASRSFYQCRVDPDIVRCPPDPASTT